MILCFSFLDCVDKIRENYKEDWKSKEMRIRQRAVALYFIDKVLHCTLIDLNLIKTVLVTVGSESR